VTVRKCGSSKDSPDKKGECSEALQGYNKIILCKCGDALCNGADRCSRWVALVTATTTAWLAARTCGQT
jgi:hypothetical protein